MSWSTTSGTHTIIWKLDTEDDVIETDEINNEASLIFSIESDSDGIPDEEDAFPNDPAASLDTDGDGYPDEWNEGKDESYSTTGLSLDDFPYDSYEWIDSDNDGIGDNSDYYDGSGQYPPSEYDGIGDDKESKESSLLWLWILIGVLFLVIIVMGVIIIIIKAQRDKVKNYEFDADIHHTDEEFNEKTDEKILPQVILTDGKMPTMEKRERPLKRVLPESTRCNICLGYIKTGLPLITCVCSKNYHISCASRVEECPICQHNMLDYFKKRPIVKEKVR